jgi:hypothetical protein
MDDLASCIGTTASLPRAGFWRRWLATIIDMIAVMFPFQILAAILFAVTAGTIQMDNGFYRVCAATTAIPQQLDPPPPHDPNFASVCRISFFGATTGAFLIVGRTTREGITTKTVTQGYMLDQDGKPVRGTSIDWIVALTFLIYLAGMIWKTGRTLGDRIARVMVIDAAEPGLSGVPLRAVIIRYLAMAIGFMPMFALLAYQSIATDGSADAMFGQNFFLPFMFAGGLAFLWCLVLVIQIARKSDPIYDRLAGTAVIKVNSGVDA